MRMGQASRQSSRRLLAAWLAALCLAPEQSATTALTLPGPPEGEPTAQTAPPPEAEAVDLHRVFEAALPSIFLVETETWKGVGFLADSSGLIVTASPAARPVHSLFVTVTPGKTVAARTLGVSNLRYGIIQVHPEAVAGLRPLPIAGWPEEATPPAKGERLVAVFLSPEGGFVPKTGKITKGGAFYLRADLPVLPGFGFCPDCPGCQSREQVCGAGLVLDSRGRVIGMDPILDKRRQPRTWMWCIRHSGEALAAARTEAGKSPPPAPAQLSAAPSAPYPREALDRLAAARTELRVYQTQAGPFLVEFLTPPLARAEEVRKGQEKGTDREALCSQPKGDRNRWRPEFVDESPVVTVRVVPEIRRRAGTYVGVSAFWVFSPAIFSVFLLRALPPYPVPHVSSRFDPAVREIELRRRGEPVVPIRPERACGDPPSSPLNIDLCPPDGQRRGKRRVRGCFLSYTYRPEAFAPGEPMELRIHSEREGESGPTSVPVDDTLLQRIRSDFEPYFEVTEGN